MATLVLEQIAYDIKKNRFFSVSNDREVDVERYLGEVSKHRFTVPENRLDLFLQQMIELNGFNRANAYSCRNWLAYLGKKLIEVSTYAFYRISPNSSPTQNP